MDKLPQLPLPPDRPEGATPKQTQKAAVAWGAVRAEGQDGLFALLAEGADNEEGKPRTP